MISPSRSVLRRARAARSRSDRVRPAAVASGDQASQAHCGRRDASLLIFTAVLASPAVAADEASLVAYANDTEKYSLQYPTGWVERVGGLEGGERGSRRVVAFLDPSKPDVNATMVVTRAGADFTSIGSLGSVDGFAEGLATQMYVRKGRKDGAPAQKAEIVKTRSDGTTYFVEYTVKPEGGVARHCISAASIRFDGVYNRFYTLTAQAPEEDFAENKAMLQQIVDSVKLPPYKPL
mmetsp:Transcript_19358/g.62975  ORF Transcript_19358/g.62975 Transcript_19358/m.62975 type:complete len:236 (+) Transcript_19358:3-710(+)